MPSAEADQQAGRVPRQIDFGDDAYTEVRRKFDQAANLLVRVVSTLRDTSQQRNAQGLIVGKMQMQHIHSACPHADQGAFEGG